MRMTLHFSVNCEKYFVKKMQYLHFFATEMGNVYIFLSHPCAHGLRSLDQWLQHFEIDGKKHMVGYKFASPFLRDGINPM